MLSIFKSSSVSKQPKPPASAEKLDGTTSPTPDVPVASALVQDAPAPGIPTNDVEPRHSSVSVPTISSTPTIQAPPVDPPQTPVQSLAVSLPAIVSLAPPSPAVAAQGPVPSVHTQSSSQTDQPMQSRSQSALPYSPSSNSASKDPRRFSFPSFSFLRSDTKKNKTPTMPSPLQVTSVSKASVKKSKPSRTLSVLIVGTAASSEKRAKESAAVVRSVIIGNHNFSGPTPNNTKSPSKSDIARVKALLFEPKTAIKVIAHLRTLPAHPNDTATNTNPIHAVCLDMPDKDIHDRHFAQLQSVATASISVVSTVLADVHLVNLLTAPNMGFGAPVTAQGLFAGALPTAQTVIEGIEQITPQLMALGYATGNSILPDHKGVIVPVDRISALTYWWGFEICLPPPTIAHLQAAESPGSALLNLLTALSILNEGVREIVPFIRYIAQFVQSEWSLIKRADEGKGVVCTATWLLPIALVPHPWNFSDPPPPIETSHAGQGTPTSPSTKRFSTTLTMPKPSTDAPSHIAPRSSSAYSIETRDEEESLRPVISSQPPVLPELVVSSPGSIDGVHGASRDGEAHDAYDKAQHDGEVTAH